MSAETIKDSLDRFQEFAKALKEEFDFEVDGFSMNEKYQLLAAMCELLGSLCQRCEVPYSVQMALDGKEVSGAENEVAHYTLSAFPGKLPPQAVLTLFLEHQMKLRREHGGTE